MSRARVFIAGAIVWFVCAPGLQAQDAQGAFADPEAERLFRVAHEAWRSVDASVVRYTALVRRRFVASLRTPLRDRTLYHQEAASRVFWDRDRDQITQILASSQEVPEAPEGTGIVLGGGGSNFEPIGFGDAFDPGGDRLIFGAAPSGDVDEVDHDEFFVYHPLGSFAEEAYRYEVGDTLTLTLPDAREIRAVELTVVPRIASPNHLTGTLWIEPESGALVRAAYRLSESIDIVRDIPDVAEEDAEGDFDLVPGFLKPWIFDMTLVTVDYALWNFDVWLPRAMRVDGEVRAGVLRVPASIDIAYRMESVVTDRDLQEGRGAAPFEGLEDRVFESREEALAFIAEQLGEDEGVEFEVVDDKFVPVDRDWLQQSPHLPPPIWDDAPGFLSEDDLNEFAARLRDLPRAPVRSLPFRVGWGLGHPGTLRYNRIEALAAGVGGDARFSSFLGPIDLHAIALFGIADAEPKGSVTLERSTLSRTIAVSGYRDLRAIEPRLRPLGPGNSFNALLRGRDDGDYYMAAGGDLTIGPPPSSRESWEVRLYGEHQTSVKTETDVSLRRAFDSDREFRANAPATELDEFGVEVGIRPWWGEDPDRTQVGVEFYGQAATWQPTDGGEWASYARTRATVRTRVPITDRWRVGFEVEGGTSFEFDEPGGGGGALPAQRSWLLGGPVTLRGYEANVARGEDLGRSRLEFARGTRFGSVTLFGDAGWVGRWQTFESDDVLYGVGVGASFLDGLVRLDLARGLTGPAGETRLDLYVDGIL
ncbi:MAG: hypothetical protein RQ745_03380 [Longimicrobiales bacterium]|nr:hypothetical protein [Longimicrobiales bacterium]